MQNEDQRAESKQQLISSKTILPQPKAWNSNDRANVAAALGKVFDLQKQFGKTTSQLKTIIEGFCWALQRYPAERVVWALGEYLLQRSDMPTPYDIRQIIDPVPQDVKFDKAYYVKLMKLREEHGKYALNDEEEAYVRDYEEHVRLNRPQ
jgi:hypothetical protein